MRLATGGVLLLMIWLYKRGHKSLAHGVVAGISYGYCWLVIFVYKDLIVGSIVLACGTQHGTV